MTGPAVASDAPCLHMMCGKIAAGKSTLATLLAQEHEALLIVEDDWLAALFGPEMTTPRDYVRCAGRLRAIMAPHIVALLQAGSSVVLDFQANTLESRAWMRGIANTAKADHRLHVLTPPDDICLARLRARNAQGEHPFLVSEAQFHAVSKHFVEPTAEEGFNIIRHQ